MSKRRHHRSIRIDERARVPFAIIAIILLLSSVTIVYALEAREAPEPSTTQSEEMDQTRATAQAQLRDSVRAATQRAAAAPITQANLDSAIGEAIGTDESGNEVGERQLFENYVSVLVYRDLQQSVGAADRDARDGTRTFAGISTVDWSDKDDVERAIDSVEISHQGSDSSMEPGLVEVTVDDVYFNVGDGDSTVDERRETLSVTVGTSVFELRDKMQEYDDDLSSGTIDPTDPGAFGGAFAARMYPFTWGKAYVDRLELHGNDGRAFPFVVDHNHTEVFANQALFSAQEEVFGTRDPHHRRVMRGPQLCMASDLIDSVSSDEVYDEDQIVQRANQSTPDSIVIDDEEDLCNNELLVGDASGDMGELNFFDLVIGPLFDNANNQFQGQDIHLVPIAELAYAETVPDFDYDEDREDEFEEALSDTDRFGEEFVEGHFGEVDRGSDAFDDEMDENGNDFTAVRDGEDARTFDDVVEDVYAVDLVVDSSSSGDSVSIGSTSRPTENHTFQEREYDVDADPIDVDRAEPTDEWSGRSDRLVTVEVTYDASISATDVYENETDGSEREVSAGEDSVSLSKTYKIDGTIAPDVEAWGTGASGVENVFDGSSDPFGDNWDGASGDAYDAVFDSDDLESELSADGDDLESDLESGGSVSSWFESQLDSLSMESNPDDLDLSPSDDSINAWLAAQTRDEHMSLVTEMDPVNATMVEIVEGDPSPIREFRDPVESNQTAAVRDVTSYSSTYTDAVQLAEAEAKYAYYENLLNRIDAIGSLNEDQSGSLNEGFDFDIMSHLDFITDFTAADVEENTGQVRGGPLLEDVDYQIDASPTYLEMDTVNRSTDPAVRPSGNGPLDVEDTDHGSLGVRYDNAFGFPGFPLLPFPPSLFYLQADAWHVTVKGEYARFEIQATSGSGSSTGGTTLVREDRSVTIADQKVGSVEPIDIDQKLPMFVIVPAPTLLAKGSPGTGDMWRQQGESDGHDCTDTWENTGPGYDQNAVDDARADGTHCTGFLEDAISEFLP